MYNYPNYNMLSPYPQQQSAGLIRVTGMDGAKMYQLSPNSAVALFDANEDIFYIKTTDGAGFPTIRSYKFVPIDTPQARTRFADAVQDADVIFKSY
jgi:hypothetical protein